MVNAVESLILGILKEFTGEDLKYAINRKVNLANLIIQFVPPAQIQFFRILVVPFSGQKDELTVENIIKWLSDGKPEFARILNNNQEATSWLNYNIKTVKRLLW